MAAAGSSRFQTFRLVAFVEGITTLILFFIAMPIKYIGGNPGPVQVAGWIHGIAFVVYVATMCLALTGRGWSWGEWGRTFAAALFPFGTFVNDGFLQARAAAGRL